MERKSCLYLLDIYHLGKRGKTQSPVTTIGVETHNPRLLIWDTLGVQSVNYGLDFCLGSEQIPLDPSREGMVSRSGQKV